MQTLPLDFTDATLDISAAPPACPEQSALSSRTFDRAGNSSVSIGRGSPYRNSRSNAA